MNIKIAHETGTFTQILHKTLDDSEITQTIVILEDDASAFRVVQTYELKRFRSGSKALAPGATYCRDSVCATRELAIEQARRLMAKYQNEGWQVCREERTAQG